MVTVQSFEDLQAWRLAMDLARRVIMTCDSMPTNGGYALKNQLCKSAISVPSNIAEGFERGGNAERIQFLYIAKGSAGELRTQIQLARNVGAIGDTSYPELRDLCIRVSKLIAGLIRYTKNSELKGTKFKE